MEIIDRFTGITDKLTPEMTNEARYRAWCEHMASEPTLRDLCLDDYRSIGLDPERVSVERVFSHPSYDTKRLKRCHRRVRDVLNTQAKAFRRVFGDTLDALRMVIYHGLGNAAGWARQVEGHPTVLLGIEKIVELSWDTTERLTDLIAHEMAHVMHAVWRGDTMDDFAAQSDRDWVFRLYAEGFATHVENRFYGRKTTQPDWFTACLQRESSLKANYVKRVKNGESCQAFFGDWHEVDGVSDAGYYLGARLIHWLLQTRSLREVARLSRAHMHTLAYEYLEDTNV